MPWVGTLKGSFASDAVAFDAIKLFAQLPARMPRPTRELWTTWFAQVYGDLSGQRGLDGEPTRAWAVRWGASGCTRDLIFGLQTYYVLVADLLALAILQRDPPRFLRDWASSGSSEFKAFLRGLSTGKALEQHGFLGAAAAFDFDWYLDALRTGELDDCRALLRHLALGWPEIERASQALDPMSALYTSLLPRNLLHILGEVYTPAWLAEMLLEDSGWTPGQRLLDPFGGTGIFLLAALRFAEQRGVAPFDVLPDLCTIEVNPFSCAAARTNLVFRLARAPHRPKHEIVLPVLGGDAFAPQQHDEPLHEAAAVALAAYGLRLPRWFDMDRTSSSADPWTPSTKHRRLVEQRAIQTVRPADVLVTNPPWVGWEYIARPYRDHLKPAWLSYGLFSGKGREACFAKENLSTLALVTAWDRFLRSGGTSVVILPSHTMTGTLAARGLRRLSIYPFSSPMRLEEIRVFDGVKVFPAAHVGVATWRVTKGATTEFPVPARIMSKSRTRWQPEPAASLVEVAEHLSSKLAIVERVTETDPGSRWILGTAECVESARKLAGSNPYLGRTGVFTGGANAVYYLRRIGGSDPDPWFTNVTTGAKREVPTARIQIEADLVHEVVRGRDLHRWCTTPELLLLCPHTRATRMEALAPVVMQSQFPKAWDYLVRMRKILDARKGFTTWERAFRDRAFYAIQRVGDYSFAPFKVAWRYIARDFVVAVIGPDAAGRPRLANDKVIFVGLDDEQEAYYLCGILSSDPFRWKVIAYASDTQISANAIAPLAIPRFDASNPRHTDIAEACRDGHLAIRTRNLADIAGLTAVINAAVASLFDFGTTAMTAFKRDLADRRLPAPPSRA